MLQHPPRVTFVLPDRNRSGGVRVTVDMANLLLERGYAVRIAYRRRQVGWARRAVHAADLAVRKLRGMLEDDWLPLFRGESVGFDRLGTIGFVPDEVVIAVGSFIIDEVRQLDAPVRKVRFCHGFHHFLTDKMANAWGGSMPTFTVAGTLVPGLHRYSGDANLPIWVVPNGIDRTQYFDEHRTRDGVGTIYSPNAAKNPADTIAAINRVTSVVAGAKRYVFSTNTRPADLSCDVYRRLPSVESARELYNRCKVWLLMSQAEGLPGPPLEAMACGTVIISTDNEGSCEIVRDGENGLLIPVGDVDAAVRAVKRVWSDDALRAKLIAGGFETAEHFSWPRAADEMCKALTDVASGRQDHAIGGEGT